MSLATLQEKIVDYITGNDVTVSNVLDAAGLNLYRSLVSFEYQDLLDTIYPASRIALNNDWESICTEFIRVLPQTNYNFNRSAEGFSALLKIHKQPDWVVMLADYEYLCVSVCDDYVESNHKGSNEVDFAAMLSRAPNFNSSICFREYNYDVLAIHADLLCGKTPDIATKEIKMLFFSDGQQCRCLELNQESWLLLLALSTGQSFRDCLASAAKQMGKTLEAIAPAALLEIRHYFEEGILI